MARPEGLKVRPQELGIGKLFESVRDAVIVAEASTGQIVLWNPAATEVFGYSPSEALELNVEALVPEPLKERHWAGLSRYRDTGHGPYIDSYTVLDLPAVRKGGEEIRVELSLSPIDPLPEAEAEGRFVLAIVRDVTERKQAEAKLRASEAELRALFAAMTDVIFVLDAQGRYLKIAPTNPSLLYKPPTELVGKTLHQVLPEAQADLFLDRIRQALETRRAVSIEYSLQIGERQVWFSAIASPMLEDSVVWVARDVTALKLVEEEVRQLNAELEDRVAERTAWLESALAELKERERGLRESKERYGAVIEQAGEGIFLFDPRTKRILQANPAFWEMFGYAAEELGRTTLYDLVPEDPEGVDRNVERALEQGQIWIGERNYRRKDGSRIAVEVSGSVISYGGEEVVCSVVRDITGRKRAEQALREVREAERNRMARDLHDGALQDLTYALAEAQIAKMISKDPKLDARLEREIEALIRAEQGLRDAVYDLRPVGARNRPFPELLGSLVEESRGMSPDCNIRLEVDEGFPSAPLGEGETELLRITQEALTNARRHANARNVLVALGTEGDRLVVKVSDDGRGFDPASTRAGVGLRSMRERAAALDGELEVESEQGKGTRVRFRAPLRSLGASGSRTR